MEKITNIEELIADAKAEEEVRREQAQDDLTNALMKSFTANLNKGAEEKTKGGAVTIPLAEYVELKQMELDYDRIFYAIMESFGLSYRHDHLIISQDDIILQTFKVVHTKEFKELEQDMVDEWHREHPDGEAAENDG